MQSKRILITNGHPAETSLSRALAEAYAEAAQEAGHEIRLRHLSALQFDPDHGYAGYGQQKPLEAALKAFQEDVLWANHIVLTTPMWWGGLPAKLKGLIDRVLVPGWAFDPRQRNTLGMPHPLLTGRSGRAIVTSDTPAPFFGLFYRRALLRQIKGQIFKFIGISPTRMTHLAPASSATAETVDKWIDQMRALGRKGI
ncbi:NAD(P)H-dependent oxidoreductase [Gymnodinialimonas sp. 2305UL16-5]|uniref:NAD(P)H-dependent oxidoreductase n=1 Tax=Gymnodinialimonas mytili TaxID=3126503 RepID=UPI003096F56B